jgi:hypothetical protein
MALYCGLQYVRVQYSSMEVVEYSSIPSSRFKFSFTVDDVVIFSTYVYVLIFDVNLLYKKTDVAMLTRGGQLWQTDTPMYTVLIYHEVLI